MQPFPNSVRYAFRVLARMEGPQGGRAVIGDLAASAGVPPAFLGKLLQSLQRAGIVDALRGRCGGVRLARPAREIRLAEIVEVLDRSGRKATCLLGFSGCTGRPGCPARECCRELSRRMDDLIATMTVEDLKRIQGPTPILQPSRPRRAPAGGPSPQGTQESPCSPHERPHGRSGPFLR